MKKILQYSFLLGLALCAPSMAAVDSLRAHNLGATLGMSTGAGLSYRYWFPSRIGVQVTVLPYAMQGEQADDIISSTGGALMAVLQDGDRLRLLAYCGAHFFYEYHSDFNPTQAILDTYPEDIQPNGRYLSETQRFTVAIGPALEYPMGHFTYFGGVGLAYVTDFKDLKGISYTIDLGIHYNLGAKR